MYSFYCASLHSYRFEPLIGTSPLQTATFFQISTKSYVQRKISCIHMLRLCCSCSNGDILPNFHLRIYALTIRGDILPRRLRMTIDKCEFKHKKFGTHHSSKFPQSLMCKEKKIMDTHVTPLLSCCLAVLLSCCLALLAI